MSKLLAACRAELESVRGEQDKVTNIVFKISPAAVGTSRHAGLSFSNACLARSRAAAIRLSRESDVSCKPRRKEVSGSPWMFHTIEEGRSSLDTSLIGNTESKCHKRKEQI